MSLSRAAGRALAGRALSHYALDWRHYRFYDDEHHLLFIAYGLTDKFMLKISHEPPALTREIYRWAAQLPGLLQATPTRQGELGVELQGDQTEHSAAFCTLFPWLEGRLLRDCLSLPNLRRWGALMAQMHRRSRALQDPADAREQSALRAWDRVYYWEPCQLDQERLSGLLSRAQQRHFQQMEERVAETLQDLWSKGEPLRIHGDLHPGNVKVHQQKLTAFDFDDAMWGYEIQDLAIALTYIRLHPRYPELLKAFRAGYTQHGPWPETQAHQLEVLCMGRLLWMANAVEGQADAVEAEAEDEEPFTARLSRYADEFEDVLHKL